MRQLSIGIVLVVSFQLEGSLFGRQQWPSATVAYIIHKVLRDIS